jgi:hypothetical protein
MAQPRDVGSLLIRGLIRGSRLEASDSASGRKLTLYVIRISFQPAFVVGEEAREHVLGGYVNARIDQGGVDFLAHHLIDRGFFTIERTHCGANDLAG